ncbi:hypothetical protein RKE29_23540 [Streptomyces sp. B1866]|uniref:hypothetical protein n=1 Tax=Streptomyces sp. B1866 TaxID=3075431 RepID=UPI00288F8C92|nr:hypothetical protein [Streptomyces sp. B1866]MDT3399580.1 hypothetical protein [Streptomyces sp. B1866]
MPLPFTTAGRARDSDRPAADAASSLYEDVDRWRRPYRPGRLRVGGAALLLLLASYLLFSALIIGLAGSVPGAAWCGAAGAVVTAFAVRLVRVGIWVSDQGLRQRSLWSTTTVPWRQVVSVRTVQQPVRWLGLPRGVQGQALVVTRLAEAALPAVVTDHNADFLGRPGAFRRAAEGVQRWAAGRQRH